MAKSGNQKGKLLYLAEIFHRETDEAHGLTLAELTERLAAYGVQAERKTLYADMEELRRCGLDIDSWKEGREYRYRLASREFELPELKLLVDAVQASRFITESKSRSLIKKLESLVSVHDARQLQRQVLIAGRVKTMNESVYYSVDLLHEAIQKNSRITFRYFDYDLNGSRRYRPGLYTASPYALCWQDENYYLIAHSERHGLTHYRVDKMASISMTGQPRYMDAQTRELDLTEYGKNVFGMFAGSREQLRLRFDRSLAGVVIDRFGRGTPCVPDGPDAFICTVEVAVSPNFFGWLASCGARAQLLSPAPVREAFVTLCRAAETANT